MKRKNLALSMVERSMEEARLTQPSQSAAEPASTDCFAPISGLPANIEVAPGTVLVEQGVLPGSISILCRGLVRLVSIGPDGRQTTLGLRTAGWYAGAVQVVTNTPSPYSVVAVTECSLSRVPAAEFSLQLAQSAAMMQHFVAVLCNEVSSQIGPQTQEICDVPTALPAPPLTASAVRAKPPQRQPGSVWATTRRHA